MSNIILNFEGNARLRVNTTHVPVHNVSTLLEAITKYANEHPYDSVTIDLMKSFKYIIDDQVVDLDTPISKMTFLRVL